MDLVQTLPVEVTWCPVRTLAVESLTATADGDQRRTVEGEVVTVGTASGNDLQLAEPTVSRFHVELSATPAGILVVDRGSKNGTFAGEFRIQRAVVPVGTELRVGLATIRVSEGKGTLVALSELETLGGMKGASSVMRRLFGQIAQLAKTSTALLIQGESGTGKELVARAIHDLGPRASRPFVTVDCGSLAPSLVSSELFGHEAGAFTGADRRHVGAFERAQGGTIFLDEVGELPLSLQTNLLGVIERRRLRRLGGSAEIAIDVRILSATNRDLPSEVNAGLFRLDLFYRIAVVVLKVAPLRERPEDITPLIAHFLNECGHTGSLAEVFSAELLQELRNHRWPGNVRELRNVVEATLATGEVPHPHLDPPVAAASPNQVDPFTTACEMNYKDARGLILNQFEARYLRYILSKADGNVARAARQAKMNRSYLIDLLGRHRLRASEDAPDDGGGGQPA